MDANDSLPELNDIDEAEFHSLVDEIDVVIMTATPVEFDAVLRLTEPWPRRQKMLRAHVDAETYFLGRFGSFKAVVTKCQMGSLQAGSSTLAAEQAQRVCRPRAIIMIGIAFGRDAEKQQIADVLVASEIIAYESQRVGEEIVYRGSIPPSNPTLLNRFENVHGWEFSREDGSQCKVIRGPVLSGEKLIDEPEFKQALFDQFPQAVGGEMEGVGLCAAAQRCGVPWILVKSICDWADGNKHKEFQPLAAAASASLVQHVLTPASVLNGLEKPGVREHAATATSRGDEATGDGATVSRDVVIEKLSGLISADFGTLRTALPACRGHVDESGAVANRVNQLINWSEGGTGPGLDAVVTEARRLFGNRFFQ